MCVYDVIRVSDKACHEATATHAHGRQSALT